jgi:hypothetical protein
VRSVTFIAQRSVNAIVIGHDLWVEKELRKNWEKMLESYKKHLPGLQASLRTSEAMLSPDELDRLPKQINRDEFVKSVKEEIANKKSAVKGTEESIENAERWLRALPLIKVLEWAEPPAPKK